MPQMIPLCCIIPNISLKLGTKVIIIFLFLVPLQINLRENKTRKNPKLFVSFLYKLENKLPRQANIWASVDLKEARQHNTATYVFPCLE